jgi:LysM repeat protein
MNTPNPLLPQGSLPARATSKIGFKILMILAIHVVVIGGLLMQGCSKDKASTTGATDTATATNTSPTPTTPEYAPTPAAPATTASTPAPVPSTGSSAALTTPLPAPVASTPTPAPTPMPAATPASTPGVAKEYVIVSGDTLAVIAKRNGVSIKALQDANPGVEPKKLQIGHKLQIPAGNAVASSTTASPAPATSSNASTPDATAAAGDGSSYTVKAGDRLLKIAATHGTTVKAIQALNDMKTTAIRAGQKIKLPVMKVASMDSAPASTHTVAPGATTSGAAPAMPATTAN